MSSHLQSCARVLSGAAVAFTLTCGAMAAQAQNSGPFEGLAGAWSGNGSISMNSGSSERLHCRATYEVSPSGLNLAEVMRCASDAYKFEVRSRVVYQDGALAGTWTEVTRNATGSVSGRVNGPAIQISVDGPGFTAQLAIVTRGDRQSVTIHPQGADIREVTVDLHRS